MRCCSVYSGLVEVVDRPSEIEWLIGAKCLTGKFPLFSRSPGLLRSV